MEENSNKKKIAITLLIIIGLSLCYLLSPYLKSIFLGLVFFILSKPIYSFLRKHKFNHTGAFFVVTFLIFIIILIPFYLITISSIVQINSVVNDFDYDVLDFVFFDNLIDKINSNFILPDFSTNIETIQKTTTTVINYIKNLLIETFSNIFDILLEIIIALFILYYALKPENKFSELIIKHSPFTKENTEKLIQHFINISNSGIIVSGISAIIQSVLLTTLLMIFKTPGSLLLGLISFLLAFIPLIGVYFIWIPVSIINFIGGNTSTGIWIAIGGLIISNIDTFYRPILQKKFGKIHPLIALIGTFMGLKFFGFIGIIIGPLILSYFFMIFKMIDEEFFSK